MIIIFFFVSEYADRSASKSHLDLFQVVLRTPALADQTFLSDVEVEHVQHVVDRLDLPDLDEPDFDVLGGCNEYAMPMLLSLTEHLLKKSISEQRSLQYVRSLICLLLK